MKVSIGGYTFTSFSDAVSFAMRRYDMTRKKAEQYVKQLEIKQRDSNTVAKKQTASRINNAIEQSFKRLDSEVRREQRKMSKIKSKAVVNPYTYGTGGGTRGWWTEGGVDPARTKMVFQPLGARSIAESYKNLVGANSSTNAAPGTAPDFAAATGWEFNGSSHYLQVSMAPVVVSPISILVLFKPLQLTTSDCMICITDNAVTAAEYWALYFRGAAAGDPAWAVVEHLRTEVTATSTTGYTAGTWAVAAMVCPNNVDKIAYMNGGGKTTTSTEWEPVGVNETNIGALKMEAAFYDYYYGYIGAVAIYDTALSDKQIQLVSTAMLELT